MMPRELIASAAVPGGGELRLVRRGEEYSIMLGANELMNSRLSGSEEALAALACARLAAVDRPHILIGGLGMGFTLRAALAQLGAAEIVVAELVPAVVEWARGAMAHIFAGSLDDPRVDVSIGDVGGLIVPGAAWDAILLDVDNGPDALSRAQNDRLYDLEGLRRTRTALRRGGVLAVWSSAPDSRFTARLKQAGFAVEETVVRARGGGRGARHLIWLATAP
jgi:spermidine synthase